MRKRPLVVIEFRDPTSSTEWLGEKNVKAELPSYFCVGWMLKRRSNGYMILATWRSTDGDCFHRHSIPCGAIKSIRRLE